MSCGSGKYCLDGTSRLLWRGRLVESAAAPACLHLPSACWLACIAAALGPHHRPCHRVWLACTLLPPSRHSVVHPPLPACAGLLTGWLAGWLYTCLNTCHLSDSDQTLRAAPGCLRWPSTPGCCGSGQTWCRCGCHLGGHALLLVSGCRQFATGGMGCCCACGPDLAEGRAAGRLLCWRVQPTGGGQLCICLRDAMQGCAQRCLRQL